MDHPLTPAPTIQEKISIAAPSNNRLRQILQETSFAPSAIRKSKSHISYLHKLLELKECKALFFRLKQREQQAEHQWCKKRSGPRRPSYNLMGKREKFEQKVASTEKRALDIAQKYTSATNAVKAVETELENAKAVLKEEERAERMRVDALDKLNHLYDSIFEGPTPEFPLEDLAEAAMTEWKEKLKKARQKLEKERIVFNILKGMKTELFAADSMLARAEKLVHYSTLEAEGEERRLLTKAREHVEETDRLIRQAREPIPGLMMLGSIYTAHICALRPVSNGTLSGVDDIFTIKRAREKLKTAMIELKAEKKIAGRKVWMEELETENVEKSLKERQESLQMVRQSLFNQVADELPAYKP